MTAPQSVLYWPKKRCSPTAAVYLLSSCMNTKAKTNSFQAVMNAKMLVATSPGATSGSSTERNMRHQPQPSR